MTALGRPRQREKNLPEGQRPAVTDADGPGGGEEDNGKRPLSAESDVAPLVGLSPPIGLSVHHKWPLRHEEEDTMQFLDVARPKFTI